MKQNDTKPILAIETSGDVCSASILYNENNYSEINLKYKNIHSEKLLEIIQHLLEMNEIELSNLNSIAVSSGPGSFTGLRIGMSTAKALAFGAGLPIIPVSTFEALALQLSSNISKEMKFIIATKVNVDEVYYAKYLKKEEKYIIIDELEVLSKEKLKTKINKNDLVFSNATFDDIQIEVKPISAPNASFVGKWAYLFGKDLLNYTFDFLEPDYLKNFVVKTKGE